ncbi:hypothetical protein NAI80_10455, partial [Francisella tularensis subsp. holarctica]|nr:hypothetical protein [Francisella tularensis subsp. holarctica]
TVLQHTAPAFKTTAGAENKIKVTVVAIDNAGVRSDESAELGIAVKADMSIKPCTPSLSAPNLAYEKTTIKLSAESSP